MDKEICISPSFLEGLRETMNIISPNSGLREANPGFQIPRKNTNETDFCCLVSSKQMTIYQQQKLLSVD